MRIRKSLLRVVLGLGLLVPPYLFWNKDIWRKLMGRAPDCAWSQAAWSGMRDSWFLASQGRLMRQLTVVSVDRRLGIEQVRSPKRAYWVKSSGLGMDGRELIAYLLLHIDQGAAGNPDHNVRHGEVVLDCGAHVGVFTAKALELGASKVVAIEPDPTNLECLRRNFAEEVRAGRVIVCPRGVWSSETTLELAESNVNSGMDSAVLPRDGTRVRIPVTTIDRIVRELSMDRVDFIKMDIEGAEREALQGAAETLRQFSPRLAVDSYHRVDDMAVFRRLLPAFQYTTSGCQPCDENPDYATPHVTFWQRR